ncbi:MAG: hypothetical protein IJZ88_00730 [Clostridia bacterium]|nr:hypothetical protein [Clostridia bacterium]
MKSNDNFDINSFSLPDVSFAPVYVWVWNDICNCDIIDRQLDEMKDLGIRAFYILPEPKEFRPDNMPTNLTPDYLSSEYFELCAYAVKKAESLGMLCWIYDEGGWPSGGACGKVLQDHPEYARQTLKTYEKTFFTSDIYKKTNSDILAAFFNNNEMIEEGHVFSEDTVVTEYTAEKVICGNSDYPDLLNKNATDYFIKITHERYASSMQRLFGKTIKAVFTDEPKAPSPAFNKELAQKYESLYGESILPHLPLIAHKEAPTEENVNILHRWYDLCSRVFCDNFLLPCKKWANEHGIAFTGHMDMDHSPLGCIRGGGNFNLMRALRCLDIPGVDIIRRQLYPENKITNIDDFNAYNGFFPRYASSAAAHNGTKLAMSEIFGVAGAAVTYDIMRYTIGYQAVRGINVFNPFNFPLGRKDHLLAQELPVFTKNQPYYQYLGQFNRYVERISYLSTVGKRVCETGLYYPVYDFQGGIHAETISKKFNTLGRALEDMVVDFDIVDDDVIQAATGIDNGCICMGNAVYKHIVIPEGAFIPEETKKVLNRFIEGGGKVTHNLSSLTSVIQIDGEGLRAMHRKAENADLFFFFREKGECKEYVVHLPSPNGYLLDLLTGKPQRFEAENGILKLSPEIGETAVILITDEIPNTEIKKNFSKSLNISGDFFFCKDVELICNKNGFEIIKHTDNPISVNLGDWADFIGSDYSGSGVYETTFTLPDEETEKEGELDLGDVHFAAEVILNGQPLGSVFMPPYRIKIPADVLDKKNELKITVTNTSANWYIHTDYFSNRSIKELSPYFEDELNYAKDLVSGGLYGPVTLYT